LGFSISQLCFEGPQEQLKLTEYQQPAICTVSVAALRVLHEQGVKPAVVAGHSLGEYAANVAAGSLKFTDAVRTVRQRGIFMQEAVPHGLGAMAAVLGLSSEETAKACADAAVETRQIVSAANFNSPEQTVISGEAPAVERAAALCKEHGAKRVVMLQVSAPFHCALMQPAQDRLAELLRATEFATPRVPVAVNVDAALVTDPGLLREALIRQVTGAVRWAESVRLLIAEDVTFVEVGPGKVLTGLMRQIDRGQTCWNVEDGAGVGKVLEAISLE
jgi:[acyl-carrier-protein] S-malonyltransferase